MLAGAVRIWIGIALELLLDVSSSAAAMWNSVLLGKTATFSAMYSVPLCGPVLAADRGFRTLSMGYTLLTTSHMPGTSPGHPDIDDVLAACFPALAFSEQLDLRRAEGGVHPPED